MKRFDLVRILMVTGISLFIVFIIITKIIFDIPTVNNFPATIGALTMFPFFIGLIIYSKRIKSDRPLLCMFLRIFSGLFISATIILGIVDLAIYS